MKISVLQPKIIRGDIAYNLKAVGGLLNRCEGQLAVTGEYVLTGSLVLDREAEPGKWAEKCSAALMRLNIPKGKTLLVNRLAADAGILYNESVFLPEGGEQRKCFPDETELSKGVLPGKDFSLFTLGGRRFKVLICSDLRHIAELSTDGTDFLLFIFHFTKSNFGDVIERLIKLSVERGLPVAAASLSSDLNCGRSTFIDGGKVASLGDGGGILELEL